MGKLATIALSNIGVTLITMILFLPFAPLVEAYMFPVIGKMEIVSSERHGKGFNIMVRMEKY